MNDPTTNSYGTDTEANTSLITVVAPVVTATFSTSTTKLDQNEQSRRVEVSLSDASTGDNTTNDPIQDRLWTITKPAATTETFTGPYVSTIYGTNTTEAGFYGVALTVTSKCGTTASTSNTKAFAVPYLPPMAYFVGAPMVGIVTHTVTFTNQATGDGLSYLWSFGDTATSTSTATTLTHSYTAATVATVRPSGHRKYCEWYYGNHCLLLLFGYGCGQC